MVTALRRAIKLVSVPQQMLEATEAASGANSCLPAPGQEPAPCKALSPWEPAATGTEWGAGASSPPPKPPVPPLKLHENRNQENNSHLPFAFHLMVFSRPLWRKQEKTHTPWRRARASKHTAIVQRSFDVRHRRHKGTNTSPPASRGPVRSQTQPVLLNFYIKLDKGNK